MEFLTDKQTLSDLNLFGRYRKNAIIGFFDRTHIRESRKRLEEMFHNPLSDAEQINRRSAVFAYFSDKIVEFPFSDADIDRVDGYTASQGRILSAKMKQVVFADPSYNEIQSGLECLLGLSVRMHDFMARFSCDGSPFAGRIAKAESKLDFEDIARLHKSISGAEVPFRQTERIDRHVRKNYLEGITAQIDILCDLDVCLSVAAAAAEKSLVRATALGGGGSVLRMKGVFHLSLKKPVGNDIDFEAGNVFFLTGVNMAGKSTFMKSVSIALYLAQAGFPVPARSMEFTPVDGIFTSINVPDNIAKGYSHFYAEVLRVKHIAEEVASGKRLFIIFDELFKGTNVKDAYDATLAVTEAFARFNGCLYIISTHIIEVGEELGRRCGSIQFHYFPSELSGTRPVYSYTLADGICSDRHGMAIIRNEHIIEIIKGEKAI